jgi:hypothetical protein
LDMQGTQLELLKKKMLLYIVWPIHSKDPIRITLYFPFLVKIRVVLINHLLYFIIIICSRLLFLYYVNCRMIS